MPNIKNQFSIIISYTVIKCVDLAIEGELLLSCAKSLLSNAQRAQRVEAIGQGAMAPLKVLDYRN